MPTLESLCSDSISCLQLSRKKIRKLQNGGARKLISINQKVRVKMYIKMIAFILICSTGNIISIDTFVVGFRIL